MRKRIETLRSAAQGRLSACRDAELLENTRDVVLGGEVVRLAERAVRW